MAKEKILVVEDEKNILELLKYNLEQEGYKVLTAVRGDLGVELARKEKPDLVLLDLMLPVMDGLEICKVLKQDYKTASMPIIMLTAKGEESDKVIGLELGADDYMTKPFSPRELLARIKSVLRRVNHTLENSEVIRIGSLEVDKAKHVVSIKGKPIELTSNEFDLLKVLLEANGRVLSREMLLNKVWGYDQSLEIETRTVDMHVGQLRKKIKQEADRLLTVKNVGYRFEHE